MDGPNIDSVDILDMKTGKIVRPRRMQSQVSVSPSHLTPETVLYSCESTPDRDIVEDAEHPSSEDDALAVAPTRTAKKTVDSACDALRAVEEQLSAHEAVVPSIATKAKTPPDNPREAPPEATSAQAPA